MPSPNSKRSREVREHRQKKKAGAPNDGSDPVKKRENLRESSPQLPGSVKHVSPPAPPRPAQERRSYDGHWRITLVAPCGNSFCHHAFMNCGASYQALSLAIVAHTHIHDASVASWQCESETRPLPACCADALNFAVLVRRALGAHSNERKLRCRWLPSGKCHHCEVLGLVCQVCGQFHS